jgi:hypothetical protein
MKKQPLSLALIGWLLCIFAVVGPVGVFAFSDVMDLRGFWPYTLSTFYVLVIGRACFLAVCGVSILMGKNWSRLLFLWGCLPVYGFDLISLGLSWVDAFRFVLYLVCLYFLTRPEVVTYMKGDKQ